MRNLHNILEYCSCNKDEYFVYVSHVISLL